MMDECVPLLPELPELPELPADDTGTEIEEDALAAQDATLKTGCFQTRFLFTLFLATVYFVMGASNHVLGPSMLDLEYLTDSPMSSVAAAFTWRYGFLFVGTLLSGPIIDRVNACFILGVALLTMALTTAFIPTWRHLLGLYITNGFTGMATGFAVVCAAATIIQVWGEDAKPYQQALHLGATLGAALTPEIMKPFMRLTSVTLNVTEQSIYNVYNASLPHPAENITYLQRNISIEVSVLGSSNASNEQPQHITGTHILYGFLVIAACLVTLSISSFVIFMYQGCRFWRDTSEDTAMDDKDTGIKGKPKVMLLILFFLQSMMYGGIEEVVGGLLLTFVTVFLGWNKDLGSDLTSVFWMAITLSRAIGTALAKHFQSSRLFAVQLGIILISIVILIFAIRSHWAVAWICFSALGLGGGSLFPTLINWGQECMNLQGIETSIFFAGLAISKMAFPPLISYLFENVGAEWFLYMVFVQVVIFILCYITTVVFMHILTL